MARREIQRLLTMQDMTPRARVSLPVVQTIEPAHGPWSRSNNLGVEVAWSAAQAYEQTVLQLPEWGPPHQWCVVLGMNEYAPGANYFFEVTALIDFGSGGAMQHAEVTWLNGTILSLPCNALTILARYDYGGGVIAAPADLRLRVNLARDTRPGGRTPVRLVRDSALAGALSPARIIIPPFTRSIELIPNSDPAVADFFAAGNYVVFSFAGAAIPATAGLIYLNDYGTRYRSIPIPSHARYVRFYNSTAAPLGFTWQFNLAL